MKERLLQYIWQFQYYNQSALHTINGEPLQVISPGSFNTNQGPDFLLAKITIGNTTWAGNVEVHISSSDWNLHKHSTDSNYTNIILHVVWRQDVIIMDAAGHALPTLELQGRVSGLLLSRYEELMNAAFFIPCEKQVSQVSDLIFNSWKQRLVIERLQKKSAVIFVHLAQNNFHWEEMFWWMLAKNFGLKINSEAFESIARSIPVNVIAKHKNQIHQLEALLFGQAGLLNGQWQEDYPVMLQKEFIFLSKKYALTAPKVKVFFLRMRPASFPTIRLAQLAMLVHHSHHLFSKVKEAENLKEVNRLLNVTANDYWHTHYRFDETASFTPKNTGSQMIGNVLINTIVPVLFAFGQHHNEQKYKDKAISWLEEISPEKNAITKGFEALNKTNKSSFDSQALIQLKNNYCDNRLCLECAVGNAILKSLV